MELVYVFAAGMLYVTGTIVLAAALTYLGEKELVPLSFGWPLFLPIGIVGIILMLPVWLGHSIGKRLRDRTRAKDER